MASKNSVDDRFRVELKAERTRRGWTQSALADIVNKQYGLAFYASTIAKMESGERDVRVRELAALSDIFGVTTDTLLGRGRGADSMWAASRLSTNAQKIVADLARLRNGLADDARDLVAYAAREGKFDALQPLADAAVCAAEAIETARGRVADLATAWPMPGVSFDR